MLAFAKFLDQKQGEARVVDQQQVLRQRLGKWLETRPSASDLAERGLLGRAQRFAAASAVVDRHLRARLQAQDAERVRVPAGSFQYNERVCSLLGGAADDDEGVSSEAVQERLGLVRGQREDLSRQLDAAAVAWAEAAEDCRRTACTRALPNVAAGAARAVQLLEAHRASTGASLAGVFEELGAFQRLLARKHTLAGIVSMVEKTDAVREAVFASGSVHSLPISDLEDISQLCASLPSRSRSIGLKRLQFVIDPARTILESELQRALQATRRWPVDPTAPTGTEANRNTEAEARAVRYCAELQRLQEVAKGVGSGAASSSAMRRASEDTAAEEDDTGPWACRALAEPIVSKFRYHFCRPESQLCRMDQPDRAFKYIMHVLSLHAEELDRWLPGETDQQQQDSPAAGAGPCPAAALQPAQAAVLREVDPAAGLALALAREARLFVRARMPVLAEPEVQPLLLNTMTHFVKFHGDITRDFGPAAGAAAFLDFVQNRPLRKEEPGKSEQREAASADVPGDSAASPAEAAGGGAGGQRPAPGAGASEGFLAGLSHLKRDGAGEVKDSHTRAADTVAHGDAGGLLGARLAGGLMAGLSHLAKNIDGDDADESLGKETLKGMGTRVISGLSQLPSGLSELRPLASLGPDALRPSGEPGFLDVWAAADAGSVRDKLSAATAESGSAWHRQSLRLRRLDGSVDGEEPEAAKLATLIGDLFETSRGRAECLSTPMARGIYVAKVLEPGLRTATSAVKDRWNAIEDLLGQAREASLLIETMEEICRFFDRFPLGVHMVPVVDEVNAVRLNMIEKISDCLADAVRKVLRQLTSETAVFSYALAPALAVLSRRLRPSNFQLVSGQGVAKIADTLMGELLRQAPFADDEQLGIFSANCNDDLSAMLSAVVDSGCLRPLGTLWESCALLVLDKVKASELLSTLRQVKRCNSSRPAVLDLAEEAPTSEVLRQKQADAYSAAGISDISVGDAIVVLLKRPDLMSTMTVDDLEDAPFSSLQDLLPAGAALGGLGASALQPLQMGAGAAQATLQMGAGAAQATLQLGARGIAGGAGRIAGGAGLLAGRLQGTLQRGLAGAVRAQ